MTINDVAHSAPATPSLIDGPALWPAQAHTPSVLGRQLVVERGEGCWLYTTDGRKLFDGTAGLWHANVGHGHPELAQAAYEQMLQLETYTSSRATRMTRRCSWVKSWPRSARSNVPRSS